MRTQDDLDFGAVLEVLDGERFELVCEWVTPFSTAAFGALVYSAINSPGYYADMRQYGSVAMFMVFAALSAAALVYLIS